MFVFHYTILTIKFKYTCVIMYKYCWGIVPTFCWLMSSWIIVNVRIPCWYICPRRALSKGTNVQGAFVQGDFGPRNLIPVIDRGHRQFTASLALFSVPFLGDTQYQWKEWHTESKRLRHVHGFSENDSIPSFSKTSKDAFILTNKMHWKGDKSISTPFVLEYPNHYPWVIIIRGNFH